MPKKADYIFNNMKNKDKKKGFTLVMTFSRRWCIHNFFATFMKMDLDMKNIHLLIFDNTDNALIEKDLMYWVEALKEAFLSTRLWKSYSRGVDRLIIDADIGFKGSKLPFIYKMQEDIIKLVHTDVFVQLEDDTLAPPKAVTKLVKILKTHKNCGVATAIETGRSQDPWAKTRLGVHYIKMKGHMLIERLSLSPHHKGHVKVEGCGFYCFATYTNIWREAFKKMPADMDNIPRFAMDNIFTNKIYQMGFDIIADFSLWCAHMNIAQTIIIFWGKKQAIKMADLWIPKYKTYAQGIMLHDNLDPVNKERFP